MASKKAVINFLLGQAVAYTVPEKHATSTKRGEEELVGSIHHPQLVTFAGVIGRVNEDAGTADLLLFIPNGSSKWVEGVSQGDGEGEFALVAG